MAATEFTLGKNWWPQHDRNDTIWRYMDLWRFCMMTQSASLWLSRADRFDDVFEGSISEVTNQFLTYGPDVTEETIERIKRSKIKLKQWTYVTCWQRAEDESALMWSAYAPQGVAVRTTYAKPATLA